MTSEFDILWAKPFPIAPHAVMAVAALLLGAIQIFGPKGNRVHRILGYIWVLLMIGIAVTAIFIWELRLFGPLSPIHLLIPLTLWGLWQAVRAARRRDVKLHRASMVSLYVYALVITGAFTLLPGRTMYQVLLAD